MLIPLPTLAVLFLHWPVRIWIPDSQIEHLNSNFTRDREVREVNLQSSIFCPSPLRLLDSTETFAIVGRRSQKHCIPSFCNSFFNKVQTFHIFFSSPLHYARSLSLSFYKQSSSSLTPCKYACALRTSSHGVQPSPLRSNNSRYISREPTLNTQNLNLKYKVLHSTSCQTTHPLLHGFPLRSTFQVASSNSLIRILHRFDTRTHAL